MTANALLLAGEVVAAGAAVLVLHALERRLGLAPLLMLLAVLVALLQSTATAPVYVTVGGVDVLTSDVVILPAVLLALLLIYVLDGTSVARVAMAEVLAVGLITGLFLAARARHLDLLGGSTPTDLPANHPVFEASARYALVSVVSFAASLTALATVYQTVVNAAPRRGVWLAPGLALVAALLLDDAVFRTLALGWDYYVSRLPGSALGRVTAGSLLWPLAALYLARREPRVGVKAGRPSGDLFMGRYESLEASMRRLEARTMEAEEAARRAEQRFRETFEQAAVGLAEMDLRGRLTLVNPALARLLGTPSSHLTGRYLTKLVAEEERAGVKSALVELAQHGGPVVEIDCRLLRHDREAVWTHLTASAARDEDGRPHRLTVVVEDLSDRLAAEEARREADRTAALQNLTGGIAHDFNNMLQVILAELELLQEGQASEGGIEAALDAANRGAEITRKLLAFTRTQPLQPGYHDLAVLLEEARGEMQRAAGAGVELRLPDPDSTLRVHADAKQLRSALVSLAANAGDAMGGTGVLTVEAAEEVFDPERSRALDIVPGAYVRIEVTDTGGGMDPDVANHALDPFFTTKDRSTSSGLGLSMVHGFARQSGGAVRLDNRPGEGLTVCLVLPSAPPPQTEPPPAGESPGSSP